MEEREPEVDVQVEKRLYGSSQEPERQTGEKITTE